MSEVAEETTSRAEEAADNFDAAVAKYGAENYGKIILSVLKDISVSLGMLVDAGSTDSQSEDT